MKKFFLILLIFSSLSFSDMNLEKYKFENKKEEALISLFKAIKTKNNIYAISLLTPQEKIDKKSYIVKDDKENRTTIDINWKDRNGYDAISIACIYNNLDMLKYLLKNGAKLNYYTVKGRTLLVLAISYNSNKVSEYLIDNYSEMINMPCLNDGWLPLQEASLKENKKIVLKLLKKGAIIRKKDNNGYDVYDLATRHGKGVMVKIIRDYEIGKLK